MTVGKSIRQRWKAGMQRFLKDNAGSIALEGAVSMIVLIVMILPMIDLAEYIRVRVELRQALRAGGQHALRHSEFGDFADIAAAVTNATTLSPLTIVVGPDKKCECLDASVIDCPEVDEDSLCDDDTKPGEYLKIKATYVFDPSFISIHGYTANLPVDETMNFRVF